jgi:hypothetical protein
MPAIDLTKLKERSEELGSLFDQPELFLRRFVEILEYYSNRTLRVSQVVQRSNLPTYNTPRPVLLQIENTLEKLSDQSPEAAINLTRTLWNASFYEARLLSAFILGTIPPSSTMSLLTSLPERLYETKDQAVKNALLTSALARLRKENPQTLMLVIKEWLNAPGPKTQTWGLYAFLPLIQQLGYDDLPQIFEILRPAIETVSPATQTDIQACIDTIYRISPIETIHYLTEIIQGTDDHQVLRIFMRIIRVLPAKEQKDLAALIKERTNPHAEKIQSKSI